MKSESSKGTSKAMINVSGMKCLMLNDETLPVIYNVRIFQYPFLKFDLAKYLKLPLN